MSYGQYLWLNETKGSKKKKETFVSGKILFLINDSFSDGGGHSLEFLCVLSCFKTRKYVGPGQSPGSNKLFNDKIKSRFQNGYNIFIGQQ